MAPRGPPMLQDGLQGVDHMAPWSAFRRTRQTFRAPIGGSTYGSCGVDHMAPWSPFRRTPQTFPAPIGGSTYGPSRVCPNGAPPPISAHPSHGSCPMGNSTCPRVESCLTFFVEPFRGSAGPSMCFCVLSRPVYNRLVLRKGWVLRLANH